MELDMRTQIIMVATDLFMSQGYMATSTRDIAKILDISQPALYHHFSNKEELYSEVLLNFAQEIGDGLTAILKQNNLSPDSLIEMTLYLKDNHPVNLSLMMHDMNKELSKKTHLKLFNIFRENYFIPFYSFFKEYEKHFVDGIDASIATRHFLQMISSYITERDSRYDNPLDIPTIVNIFMRGLMRNNT